MATWLLDETKHTITAVPKSKDYEDVDFAHSGLVFPDWTMAHQYLCRLVEHERFKAKKAFRMAEDEVARVESMTPPEETV